MGDVRLAMSRIKKAKSELNDMKERMSTLAKECSQLREHIQSMEREIQLPLHHERMELTQALYNRLPLELRNMVYGHLIKTDKPIIVGEVSDANRNKADDERIGAPTYIPAYATQYPHYFMFEPAYVDRAVAIEALETYFAENIFHITLDPEFMLKQQSWSHFLSWGMVKPRDHLRRLIVHLDCKLICRREEIVTYYEPEVPEGDSRIQYHLPDKPTLEEKMYSNIAASMNTLGSLKKADNLDLQIVLKTYLDLPLHHGPSLEVHRCRIFFNILESVAASTYKLRMLGATISSVEHEEHVRGRYHRDLTPHFMQAYDRLTKQEPDGPLRISMREMEEQGLPLFRKNLRSRLQQRWGSASVLDWVDSTQRRYLRYRLDMSDDSDGNVV